MKKRDFANLALIEILENSPEPIEIRTLISMIESRNRSYHITARLIGILASKNQLIYTKKVFDRGKKHTVYYHQNIKPNTTSFEIAPTDGK